MHRTQTQVREKDHPGHPSQVRQVLPVYEEPPGEIIETRYVPYLPATPRTSVLPDIPGGELREAVDTIAGNAGQAIAWTGYIVIRVGAVLVLVAAVALKAVAVTLAAIISLLFSALSSPTPEDRDWGPAPDYSDRTGGRGININVTVNQHNHG